MTPEQRAEKALNHPFNMRLQEDCEALHDRIAAEIRAALKERDREWCIAIVAGSPDPSVVQSITAEFCQARTLKAQP